MTVGAARPSASCACALQVLAKQKHRVPGTVRDVSASGATLFIEPKGLEATNTKLRQLAKQEAKLVQIVLKKLSNLVGEPKVAAELQQLQAALALLHTATSPRRPSLTLDVLLRAVTRRQCCCLLMMIRAVPCCHALLGAAAAAGGDHTRRPGGRAGAIQRQYARGAAHVQRRPRGRARVAWAAPPADCLPRRR